MLYLDNAATTKVSDEVFDSMKSYFTEYYGNPEAKFYDQALKANEAIENAREQVSKLFNCNPEDIIFNSGSTEGNNTIIKGIFDYNDFKGNMITTKIEHSSIYMTCKYIENKNVNVKYLNVDKDGIISLDDFKKLLDNNTKLVSIIYVNNETGTIQPIKEIANICYEQNIPLHVDATQAVGKINIDLNKLRGISFLTFSAHKIYGPKGVGCLIQTKNNKGHIYNYTPLIHGGNQESGYRSGTSNVPGIVGCGKACEIIRRDFKKLHNNIVHIQSRLINILKKHLQNFISFNFDLNKTVPGILSCKISGINNELFLKSIHEIFGASTGSACSNLKPSRILKEVGLSQHDISESIRISFSPYITDKELDELDNKLGE